MRSRSARRCSTPQQYRALKDPTPNDTLHFGVRALTAIADTGVTLQELAALLQELGPVLPLLVKLGK